MAHARPCVPKMARPHIRVAAPVRGAPRRSQEVSQDAIGFLACLTSFHLVRLGKPYVCRTVCRCRCCIQTLFLPVLVGRLFWTSIYNKSFPELEHLAISELRHYFSPIGLPDEFLGGSTSPCRLRNIFLHGLYLPALPQLLLSNRDLVSLHLGYAALIWDEFISPDILSDALSATTRLEYLYIDCPVASHPELMNADLSPLNLVVLPVLTHVHLEGLVAYMENLVSQIHAPKLEYIPVKGSRISPSCPSSYPEQSG